MRVLVVEDERKVAKALKEGLTAEQYEVVVAVTGDEGLSLVNQQAFDFVVLDLMLPGRSGLEILAALRKRGLQTPVLVLTARDAVEDRVVGLDGGADDYLVKPFAFPELLARIRALLRRGRTAQVLRFQVADLEMDLITRRVLRGGGTLTLTAKEFELLEYFLRHAGSVVSREMLARDVWQQPARDATVDNLIDVHVARLRKRIDEPFARRLLKTIRGVGFCISETDP